MKSVLCIDPNQSSSMLVAIQLIMEGVQCVTVRSAEDAILLLDEISFDLFALNEELFDPHLRCFCRDLYEKAGEIPIIIYSGKKFVKDLCEGAAPSDAMYLARPLQGGLIPSIKEILYAECNP
jgi:DNA-binding response OmpR family regulator